MVDSFRHQNSFSTQCQMLLRLIYKRRKWLNSLIFSVLEAEDNCTDPLVAYGHMQRKKTVSEELTATCLPRPLKIPFANLRILSFTGSHCDIIDL